MAEQVQAMLDRMVAPLKDLQDRGVFTQEEIHAIVDRRRTQEYALRRKGNVRKADYLRYIQDEMQLERLRELRSRHQRSFKNIGDKHIKLHIQLLWTRTLRRFRELPLYLQYAEYLKQKQ